MGRDALGVERFQWNSDKTKLLQTLCSISTKKQRKRRESQRGSERNQAREREGERGRERPPTAKGEKTAEDVEKREQEERKDTEQVSPSNKHWSWTSFSEQIATERRRENRES